MNAIPIGEVGSFIFGDFKYVVRGERVRGGLSGYVVRVPLQGGESQFAFALPTVNVAHELVKKAEERVYGNS